MIEAKRESSPADPASRRFLRRGPRRPTRRRHACAPSRRRRPRHASLGAVLVAQTRPHEAIDVLESAHRYVSEHPSFDHVRWMLAQAHLCAASTEFRAIRADAARLEHRNGPDQRRDENDPRLDAIGAHREEARPSLEIIRAHERARESPAFAGLTDISRSDRICRRDWLSTITKRRHAAVPGEAGRKRARTIAGSAGGSACAWSRQTAGVTRRKNPSSSTSGVERWMSACRSWGASATSARVGTGGDAKM